ncbi:MAG TPA: LuxR C-terminal-related transcriptional regulator [Steroidobacteraceae bacterium]|jgi:DNA-binding CsgD family transcriptional regulator|nr:LuxR C-terminal-related transcriptional regulator [Steroidobacteraceae bacterium]
MASRSRPGRPPHDDVLTPAEWRTVHAVKHGLTSRQIAERRGISIEAVKYHVANALAKLGLNNRQELRRWHRPPKGSALALGGHMNEEVKFGSIAQIARSVRDIVEAEEWYKNTLGLPHLYTFGKLAFFDCNGTRLMLSQESAATPESILYLRVADIAAAHQRLASRGVEFINAPHMVHRHADGTEEWLSMFKDPEGRPLGLMAQAKAKA